MDRQSNTLLSQGRKRGGGIRFGEMERDALIAHGTSFLLQDRLMNCSDYSTAWVCRTCGSLISLGYDDVSLGGSSGNTSALPSYGPAGEYCRICRAVEEEKDEQERRTLGAVNGPNSLQPGLRVALPRANVLGHVMGGGDLDVVAVPFVFRYLCAELASMGIAISLEVQ